MRATSLLCVLLSAIFAEASDVVDFVAVDVLPDGEVERHVHFRGIAAKETSTPGLRLRQVTDGAHLLQLIYEVDGDGDGDEEGILRDCEVVRRRRVVADFLLGFRRSVERGRNVTLEPLGAALPPDVARWLDFRRLREQCQSRHRQLRRLAHASQDALQRAKRSLLMAPGTHWCGPNGKTATGHQLGPLTAEDRCCRQHDRCRTNIYAFSSAFGFFNYRPFTLSHCRCDNRFRTCLKMAGTGAANLVGKLFFNVVQTQCFVLKPKKVCTSMSYWGKCQKYRYRKQAHLRNNLSY